MWLLFCMFFVGVPGVKPERLEEGMTVRHCALSLVGNVLNVLPSELEN